MRYSAAAVIAVYPNATVLLLAVALLGHAAQAAGPDSRIPTPTFGLVEGLGLTAGLDCQPAIEAAERSSGLPPRLLGAIGLVESGRADPRTGRTVPWPWTINVAGVDRVFETKAAAIAGVEAAQAAGVQSIDVGCMQINLMYHPGAFVSLDQAFDPQANASYAAGFLNRLFGQSGDWRKAAAAYHSQTPGLGDSYARRVFAVWPLAARYGGVEPATLVDRDLVALSGQCREANQLAAAQPTVGPMLRQQLQQTATDRTRWVAMGLLPQQSPAATPRAVPSLGGTAGLGPHALQVAANRAEATQAPADRPRTGRSRTDS